MTKQEKYKLWIVCGLVVLAIIIWLLSHKAAQNVQEGNVLLPAFNLPASDPYNVDVGGVTVPGLPNNNPYEFQAISPCMCNGMSTSTPMSYPVVNYTYITNEGNTTGNTYNYGPSSSDTGFSTPFVDGTSSISYGY